jgi:hypothetical protein
MHAIYVGHLLSLICRSKINVLSRIVSLEVRWLQNWYSKLNYNDERTFHMSTINSCAVANRTDSLAHSGACLGNIKIDSKNQVYKYGNACWRKCKASQFLITLRVKLFMKTHNSCRKARLQKSFTDAEDETSLVSCTVACFEISWADFEFYYQLFRRGQVVKHSCFLFGRSRVQITAKNRKISPRPLPSESFIFYLSPVNLSFKQRYICFVNENRH